MNPEPQPINADLPPAVAPPHYPWYQKAGAVLFVIFCFEIGICLLLLPWSPYWNFALFPYLDPRIWQSPYVKGAISGLGIVNIWISFLEVVRLRRFADGGSDSDS